MATPSSLRRFTGPAPKGRGLLLPAYHPAVTAGNSIFPSRVYDPAEVARVLKTGHQSRKIGKTVMKGPRKGWPIFTLTLEERATCPRTCREWQSCYGNRMQAAERIVHGAELVASLERELVALTRQHPRGFMVRLHVLGDFYSVEYVEFWGRMLAELPALHLFGFTAHAPDSAIGCAVALIIGDAGWPRASIRFSGAPGRDGASRVIGAGGVDPDAIMCPAQTGGTDCCATCALCWQSTRSIAFRRH